MRKLRKYLGRISLELIQWLGLSLRNFALFDPMVVWQARQMVNSKEVGFVDLKN